jgi:hypothetical protein
MRPGDDLPGRKQKQNQKLQNKILSFYISTKSKKSCEIIFIETQDLGILNVNVSV